MSVLRIFYRLIVRPFYREPLHTSLIILAVALGVGIVLAIELAGNAAAGSFRSSVETLTGNSDLEVTAAGGVPDEVAGTLATLAYPLAIHPRIEDYAVVTSTGQTVPVIGLDLISDSDGLLSTDGDALAQLNVTDLQHLADEDSAWVDSRLAAHPGEKLQLQMNDRTCEFTVRGILKNATDAGSLVLMDIATAQRVLRRTGRVDRILIKLPDSAPLEAWELRLRSALPSGVELQREGSQTDENRRMLRAFRWNLRILSYVALVVGAFLIYNTISVSVVRRRPEIGIVRALGACRTAVLCAFLGEAVCFGVAGALLGIALGRVMATGAVKLLALTVDSLYVSSRPAPIELTWAGVLLAFLVGIGVSVASAAAPAREASLVSPVEAMARAQREYITNVHKGRDLWIALVLALLGVFASKTPAVNGTPLFGYVAALLFIAACAFAIPALVSGLATVCSGILRRVLGVEAMLASRSLAASLRRTSVLIAALATAIAMMTSVGIMVGSFRETVQIWIDNQLRADLFLRPAGDPASDRHPTLEPALADTIAKLPGVAGVDRFRGYEISYDGLPATLGAADSSAPPDLDRHSFFSGRTNADVFAEMRSGDNAVVSEPFAYKHHVKDGDSIILPVGSRRVRFRVTDIFYDYGSEKGYVIVDRLILMRYLPDPAPSNLAVYVAPGADLYRVRSEVENAIAGRNVLMFTNRALRAEAIRIFDRTFAITYALEIVAVIVAVMGIAGALLALVIDRRRELGLLRFLGASSPQVRKLILVEAGLIGLLANVAGLVLGIVLSLLLVLVINKQSFGWTIQFHWPVALLFGALTTVYVATVLAGLYPARVATRLNPIEVVHEE